MNSKGITFNNRPKAKDPANCGDCKIALDKENKVRINGTTNKRCKKCHNKYIGKYNKKRKKALQEFESWFK